MSKVLIVVIGLTFAISTGFAAPPSRQTGQSVDHVVVAQRGGEDFLLVLTSGSGYKWGYYYQLSESGKWSDRGKALYALALSAQSQGRTITVEMADADVYHLDLSAFIAVAGAGVVDQQAYAINWMMCP